MGAQITPPIFPLRPSDDNSIFLAKDLIIAYPFHKGSDTITNYGNWQQNADLILQNVVKSRLGGVETLRFNSPGAKAYNSSLNYNLNSQWSYAYWIKLDSLPASQQMIFSLEGVNGPTLQSWVDSQGIWCWQKFSTADAYSILPISTIPTQNMMLIIGVFSGASLPPVQLYTEQNIIGIPKQPNNYAVYNTGVGNQETSITSITLGNNSDTNATMTGYIGPLYIWDRQLSDSEIWQLSQDPYAPLRRNTSQNLFPSTMLQSGTLNLQGIGKSTDVSPIISDDSALFIFTEDYIQYANDPNEIVNFDPRVIDTITVSDSIAYRAIPNDSMQADAPFSLFIVNIADSINYRTTPADYIVLPETGATLVPTINVSDSINYRNNPIDNIVSDLQTPQAITINESIAYRNYPTDNINTS